MPTVKTKSEQPENTENDNPEQDIHEQASQRNEQDVAEMLRDMGDPIPDNSNEDEGEDATSADANDDSPDEHKEDSPEQVKGEEQEEGDEPDKDEIIANLRNKVAEMSGESDQREEPEGRQEDQPEPEESPQQEPIEVQAEEFVSEEEFDEIIQDRNKLNEVLNRVAAESANAAREAVLRQVPDIVSKTTDRQMTVRQSVQKFYEDNPDLQEYGSYVGHIVNKIRSEKPNAPISDVLNTAGEKAREDLGIHKEAEKLEKERRESEQEEPENDSPAFAKSGTGRRRGGKKDTRNDFQKQADEMLNAM